MSIYLERYACSTLGIADSPSEDTAIIIVIPALNEKKIITTLDSLWGCIIPPCSVEVIIVINETENCDVHITEQNNETYRQVVDWVRTHKKEKLSLYVQYIKLSKKHAGVGLARKLGMDEATRRFESMGNEKGVILCLDADCTCAPNYLTEIHSTFTKKNLYGASINFKHLTDNLEPEEKEGILQYELHLRYYINALRSIKYPFAFHTIGSSMAVRVDMYKKVGGMNKRKAGEDFHFLHKIIPFQNFEEITTTSVYPSARISHRVPFGTGKAMGAWINQNKTEWLSYNPLLFKEIELLLKQVPFHYKNETIEIDLAKLPQPIVAFLHLEDYVNVLRNINQHSTSINIFLNKWFMWFNGLKVLHLVHFLRANYYASVAVKEAAAELINVETNETHSLLAQYRVLDQNFKSSQIGLKHLYSEFR